MAKSSSFFGLRKGSTKSHTFSVYHGKQITKDRWTQVKNPQTDAQMRQRIIVKMVASMRSQLKDLLKTSFEGYEGEAALRKFTSENCKKGALDVYSWVKKDEMSAGVANYTISQGTLTPYEFKEGNYLCKSVDYSQIKDTANAVEEILPAPIKDNSILIKLIVALLGLDTGETATIVTAKKVKQDDINSTLFKTTTINSSELNSSYWNVEIYEYNETDSYFDIEISNQQEGLWLTFLQPDTDYVILTITPYDDSATFISESIVKSNDSNAISTQRLNVLINKNQGTTYEEAKVTYIDARNSGKSDKYLNTGASGVDIAGGDTAG